MLWYGGSARSPAHAPKSQTHANLEGACGRMRVGRATPVRTIPMTTSSSASPPCNRPSSRSQPSTIHATGDAKAKAQQAVIQNREVFSMLLIYGHRGIRRCTAPVQTSCTYDYCPVFCAIGAPSLYSPFRTNRVHPDLHTGSIPHHHLWAHRSADLGPQAGATVLGL